MVKEQKLVLVQVSKSDDFVPLTGDFSGKMENVFRLGWTIAQIGAISRGSSESTHFVVLLLEREAGPSTTNAE